MCIDVFVHVEMKARDWHQESFSITLHCILLRHALSLNLELIDLVRLVSSCYCLAVGLQAHLGFYVGDGDPNFGSHACTSNTLPIDTPPQLSFQLCFLSMFVFSPATEMLSLNNWDRILDLHVKMCPLCFYGLHSRQYLALCGCQPHWVFGKGKEKIKGGFVAGTSLELSPHCFIFYWADRN